MDSWEYFIPCSCKTKWKKWRFSGRNWTAKMTNLHGSSRPVMSYSPAIGYARRRSFSIYGIIFFRSIKQQTAIIQYGGGRGGGGCGGGVCSRVWKYKKINTPLIGDCYGLIIPSKWRFNCSFNLIEDDDIIKLKWTIDSSRKITNWIPSELVINYNFKAIISHFDIRSVFYNE